MQKKTNGIWKIPVSSVESNTAKIIEDLCRFGNSVNVLVDVVFGSRSSRESR